MNFNEKITPHKLCNIILIAKEVIICQEYIKLELEKKNTKHGEEVVTCWDYYVK